METLTFPQVRNLLAIGLEPAPVKFGREFLGIVVDGCGLASLDAFNRDVILFAQQYGFEPGSPEPWDDSGPDTAPYDQYVASVMDDAANEAVEWLNAQILLADHVFAVVGEGRIRSLCYVNAWAAEVGKV